MAVTTPTLDDARRAARALVAEDGVAEVLVYGSVARGDQRPGSDIDLVAIFDDLDYAERPALVRRVTERAERFAGRRCEVYVTDYPEWTTRSRRVTHSFEHHIVDDAMSLVEVRNHQAIHWEKEIALPSNNLDEAYARLLGVNNAMDYLSRSYYVNPDEQYFKERASRADETRAEQTQKLVSNAKHCCGAAAMVMETAVKSIIVIANKERAPYDHRIHELLEALTDMPVVKLIESAAARHSVDMKDIGEWRQAEFYPEKLQQLGWDDNEVIRQADALSALACDVIEICTDTLREHPNLDVTDPRWEQHEKWVREECAFVRVHRDKNLFVARRRSIDETNARKSNAVAKYGRYASKRAQRRAERKERKRQRRAARQAKSSMSRDETAGALRQNESARIEQVKHLRRTTNFTQQQIADHTGESLAFVRRHTKGMPRARK